MITITIDASSADVRLDRILRKRLPLIALSAIYKLVRNGTVTINTRRVKENYRCKEGDILSVNVSESELAKPSETGGTWLPDLAKTRFFKQNFVILHEDEHLIICNKPAGVVVHGGSGHTDHATLIDCAKAYLAQTSTGAEEASLVHRIDRDTSGVVLIAKTKPALRILNEDLRNHRIVKEYRAVCHGAPLKHKGVINESLARTHERNDGTKVKVSKDGDDAKSEYAVLESNQQFSLLEVYIHTGRTHQIRVHLQSIGCPIVGDVRYGDIALDTKPFSLSTITKRLYLHAYRIAFVHPVTRKKISVTAPVSEAFRQLMRV